MHGNDKTYITCIDGRWHAYAADPALDRVCSIGTDNPLRACARYGAPWTVGGIKYVSSPCSTRSAAYQRARRNGVYQGEMQV